MSRRIVKGRVVEELAELRRTWAVERVWRMQAQIAQGGEVLAPVGKLHVLRVNLPPGYKWATVDDYPLASPSVEKIAHLLTEAERIRTRIEEPRPQLGARGVIQQPHSYAERSAGLCHGYQSGWKLLDS